MRWMPSATLVLALCVAGCSGKTETPSGGGGKPASKPATEAAPAPTPNPKRVETTEFRFGRALSPDGIVTGEGGPFAQGETLHVSFKVSRAPAGSAYKLVVTGIGDNKKYYEEQKTPPATSGTMTYSLPETRAWPAGDYRLEMLFIDGPEVQRGTYDFKVVPPKK